MKPFPFIFFQYLFAKLVFVANDELHLWTVFTQWIIFGFDVKKLYLDGEREYFDLSNQKCVKLGERK